MSVILVVEQDASRAERISAALRRDGLTVMTVGSRAEAVRRAQGQPPELLVASEAVPEAPALLADFSRRRGGPGSVVMVGNAAANPELSRSADELLADPFSDDDLRELVQRSLKMPAQPSGGALETAESEQLTSEDIFGDVLAEVEAEVTSTGSVPVAKPSRPLGDIERRLEETLSGVLPTTSKGKRTSAAPTAESPEKTARKAEPPTDSEIDDLLDQTLSSLDIPTRPKKPPEPRLPQPRPATPAAPAAPSDSGVTDSVVPAPVASPPVAPVPVSPVETAPPPADSSSSIPSTPSSSPIHEAAPDVDAGVTASPSTPPLETSDSTFVFDPEELSIPELPEVKLPEAAENDVTPGAGFVVPMTPPDSVVEPQFGSGWQEAQASVAAPESAVPSIEGFSSAPGMAPGPTSDELGAKSVLEDLPSDADHFRTQALSTFDLAAAAAEHQAALSREGALGSDGALEGSVALEASTLEGGTAFDGSAALGSDAFSDREVGPAGEIASTSDGPSLEVRELAVDSPVANSEVFGDYTLLDRIAVGGMAEVWRARRRGVEGFRKTVAIKKILSHLTGSPDFVTMFIDEAKLAAQLSHNNIIQIYDLGKVGEDFFIAMEHVDGKDLRSILTAAQELRRPIPLGLSLLIVSAVAQALDYAHRKRDFDGDAMGLVHRDVSPQNVMISFEGAIKLCDFGIVKAVSKASTTQMGALKGKLQYMSPEQAWGKSVDARSDIFSLGSVLYEVLTGTQLFAGESEIGVLDAVRECKIESPRNLVPEIPEQVASIVLKALAKSPEERFQTAGELEQEIRAVLDDLRPTSSQKDLALYICGLFDIPKTGAVAIAAASSVIADATDAASSSADEAPVSAVFHPESFASAVQPPAEPSVSPPVVEPASDEAAPTEAPPAEAAAPPSPAPDEGSRSGVWKWLIAAILAAILIGVGFLTLPSLLRPESQEVPPPSDPVDRVPADASSSPPGVSPAPLEDALEAAADDPTSEPAVGEEPGTPAEPASPEADLTVPEASETESGATEDGINIEELVNEELTNRAEQLRRDFEAEKERIEKELARAQKENQQADEGGEGGDGVPR